MKYLVPYYPPSRVNSLGDIIPVDAGLHNSAVNPSIRKLPFSTLSILYSPDTGSNQHRAPFPSIVFQNNTNHSL